MKINEELERLLQLQQTSPGAPSAQARIDPEKFAGLLDEQLQEQVSSDRSAQVARGALSTTNQLLSASLAGLAATEEPDAQADSQIINALFSNYNETLNVLDSYAVQLSGPESDLRSAWNSLETLNSQVFGLRSALTSLSNTPEGLDGLVSEMEVLVATEQFKFNRGDYL